jgi:hypothetical protein
VILFTRERTKVIKISLNGLVLTIITQYSGTADGLEQDMKVFFAGSIRGGRSMLLEYKQIIDPEKVGT